MNIRYRVLFLPLLVIAIYSSAHGMVDPVTGLDWQQDPGTSERTWEEALDYCADLDSSGHDDWRLPNIRELESLVDLGATEPAIDSAYQCELGRYWSSTTYRGSQSSAWAIDFTTGDDTTSSKTGTGYTRCVRSGLDGPVYEPPQIIAVVETGLEWQQSDDHQQRDWQQALDYCETLDLGENQDWRLPDIRELDSIADLGRQTPAIDPSFQTQLGGYWSSTTYRGSQSQAWVINFTTGDDSSSTKTNQHYVRCVRSTDPGTVYEPPVTVTDYVTNLEWQQVDDAVTRDWQQALGYCENLDLDSKFDWRLPDVRELDSLVDLSRHTPAINPGLQTKLDNYWSSTTYRGSQSQAWSINFSTGDDTTSTKTNSHYVRCVRAAGPTGPLFYTIPSARHEKTGLEWQQSDDGLLRNWEQSLSYCENLAGDGKRDWRLPDIRELDSLVDLSRHTPAINPIMQTKLGSYWSSTTYRGSQSSAWSIDFTTGNDGTRSKTSTGYTRCVRSGPDGYFDDQNSQKSINLSVIEELLEIARVLERFKYFIDSRGLAEKLADLSRIIFQPDELKKEISSLFEGEESAKILLSLKRSRYFIEKFYDFAWEIIAEDTDIEIRQTDHGTTLIVNGRGGILDDFSIAPFSYVHINQSGGVIQAELELYGHTHTYSYEPYRSNSENGLKISKSFDEFNYSVDYFTGSDGFGVVSELAFPVGSFDVTIRSNPFLTSVRHSNVKISGGVSCDVDGFAVLGGGLSINGSTSYVLPRETYGTLDEAVDDLSDMGSCLSDCFREYLSDSIYDYLRLMIPDVSAAVCYLSCVGHDSNIEMSVGVGGKIGFGAGADVCVGAAEASVSGKLGGNLSFSSPAAILHDQLQYTGSLEQISRFVELGLGILLKWESMPTSERLLWSAWQNVPGIKEYLAAYGIAQTLDSLLLQEFKDSTWVSISGGIGLKPELEALGALSAEGNTGASFKIRLQTLIDLILFHYGNLDDNSGVGFDMGNSLAIGVGAGLGDASASINTETYAVTVEVNQGSSALKLKSEKMDSEDAPLTVTELSFVSESVDDLDFDGKNDSLNIGGNMTVNETGTYILYGSLFIDTVCVGTSSLALADVGAGTHPVTLVFDGLQIKNGGIDGTYHLNVVVFYDDVEEPVFRQDDAYTTGIYLSDGFQGGVTSFDNVVFTGTDIDGNTLFDTLDASIDINTPEALDYMIEGVGQNGFGVSATLSGSLVPGLNQLVLSFDGEEIRKQGVDGPYTFNLTLFDGNGEIQETLQVDATGFLALQFQSAGIALTDLYSDQPYDRNNNSYYDELRFDIGVQVTEPKQYIVSGTVTGDSGQFFLEGRSYLGSSDTSVSLVLDGRAIRKTGTDQQYVLSYVTITDLDGTRYGQRVNTHTTGQYNHLDFEPEAITLLGSYPVQTIDSNGNGTADILQFQVGVNVFEAGTYRLAGRLNCGGHFASIESVATLDPGNQTINLDFTTNDIFLYGSAGSCSLERLGIVNGEGVYLDYTEDTGQSFEYDYQDFDKPCSDDFDGDGFVDLTDLVQALQIVVGKTGSMLYTGDCSGNGVVGLAEVLHLLESISEQQDAEAVQE